MRERERGKGEEEGKGQNSIRTFEYLILNFESGIYIYTYVSIKNSRCLER